MGRNGPEKKKPGSALFSPMGATFAAAVLNFRVRDGNGCAHRAIAAGPFPREPLVP